MPQPVKLSDPLIEQARVAAEGSDRSMAGQIEHWARLGQSVEAVLTAPQSAALKQGADAIANTLADEAERTQLLRALRLAVTSAGHTDLGRVLRAGGRHRYGTDPAFPGCLVRISPDGKRTPGHLVQRRFVPLDAASRQSQPSAKARRGG